MNQEEIELDLKTKLSTARYHHILGVSAAAANLAINYTYNVRSAILAGLLHDCAKWMQPEDMLQYCKNNHIFISEIEEQSPTLLHGKIGADLAKKKYHIEDPEILQAIIYHTTGRPDMKTLDKIIYIADYIEPNRKMIKGLSQIKKTAYINLDQAICMISKDTLEHLKKKQKIIDPLTKETYEYYKENYTCH
jgi:nicotinate-nucleotide adenylyltransferase